MAVIPRSPSPRFSWAHPSWWHLLIVFPWALFVVASVLVWIRDRPVVERQRVTGGIVTKHQPRSHCPDCCRYVFQVEGTDHEGWSSDKNGKCPAVGEQVRIYYDPVDPKVSSPTDFREIAASRLAPVPMTLLGIVAVTSFVALRKRRAATSGVAK
jgi:Protein of unknown function (DUF3592)